MFGVHDWMVKDKNSFLTITFKYYFAGSRKTQEVSRIKLNNICEQRWHKFLLWNQVISHGVNCHTFMSYLLHDIKNRWFNIVITCLSILCFWKNNVTVWTISHFKKLQFYLTNSTFTLPKSSTSEKNKETSKSPTDR